MKYPIYDITIPQNKRREINEKILHVINTGLETDISMPDIYNAYTGEGGLHGLDFKDYNNYHEFTEAKKEIEQGQFFTPHGICKFLVECISPSEYDLVADLTCGMGNFYNFIPNEMNVYGNELDIKAYKVTKHLYPEATITCDDIRYYTPDVKFDVIFGNPPFNLKWEVGKNEFLSQLYYCLKAAELLKPGGLLALIIPDSFLKDSFMDGGMIKRIEEHFNFICQFDLPENSFRSLGVERFSTKIIVFQRKSQHIDDIAYSTDKIISPSIDETGAAHIYETYIKALVEQKEKIKAKLFYENVKDNGSEEREFQYQVKKLLFAIKKHPSVNKHYTRCRELVNKYYTQKRPEDLSHEEWAKKKLTKAKVIAQLKRTLKKQNEKEIDKIELVKTSYGIKLKAYSPKTRKILAKMGGVKEISINDMVLTGQYQFEDPKFKKLIDRKIKEYQKQNITLKDLKPDSETIEYLNSFSLYKKNTGEIINLNPIQKEDLGKVTQKRYSILNWQQGSGKTIAGIAWYKNLLRKNKVRNVFIISNALSINGNWETELDNFGENYIKIQRLSDINNIQPRQVVIISFNMLIKYQRHLKKYIKMQAKKIGVVVDESDEMTNALSGRTRAALNIFRKLPYKILTTGTVTRNNINEIYSQLIEFLYNNSINAICDCEYIYKLTKDNEIEEEINPYYMAPFPAYHGRSLFKSCFSPNKVTVFGIKKDSQDIYNLDSIRKLIEKTVITRQFREIVGRKIYEIKVHRIEQNAAEREIYRVIMDEFHEMVHYFRSTGCSRKDSMLKIIQQIQLLIKSTSTPHLFSEYRSCDLPNKYLSIFNLIRSFEGQKVAIGTVFVDTAIDYYSKLQETFPDRPIFLIKGDVTFKKRKGIINQFEATKDGILLSTQQSLKSSVNIPSCDRVIIESMQWNIPKISQYFFRFIRFNSKNDKEIHFVTYDKTIEQNLLALLMVKERINEFIMTLDFKEQAEIFNEYNIDMDILENIIERVEDEEGNMKLSWGQQKIS